MFVFYASARKVEVKKTDTLVSDSINVYPCKFQFSADWVGLTKTAVFRAGTQAIEVMLDENTECNIPWEVLLKDKLDLYVGCYGTKGEDIILNTTWTNIGKILEGTKNKAVLGEDPTPDIYTQLTSQIGDLSELQTIDKSNLVNAINEVNAETLKNADNKIDKTGDTVTGPILFTDTSAIMDYVYEDKPIESETVEGVEISSEGVYKNSEGALNIKSYSGIVDFHNEQQTSVLTGVMGDAESPDSVPNMLQVTELIDTVRDEMPTKLSELSNDVGFITRDDIPTGPSGSTEEIYSTEERRIGTWIDGKPLYRLSIETTVENPGTASAIMELPAEAEVKMFQGFAKRVDNGAIYSLPNTEPNDLEHNIALYNYNGQIMVWAGRGVDTRLKNGKFWAIAEYTKTTD